MLREIGDNNDNNVGPLADVRSEDLVHSWQANDGSTVLWVFSLI